MNALLLSSLLAATPEPATSLSELLTEVEQAVNERAAIDRARLSEFRAREAEQAKLLKQAEAEVGRLEAEARRLERGFEAGERALAHARSALEDREGTLGELFGEVRRSAGDLRGRLESSVVSAEHPERLAAIEAVAGGQEVPHIEEIATLWRLMHDETTRQGEVSRFEAPVVMASGETETQSVLRLGSFGALSQGQFLVWNPGQARLVTLRRQPPARLLELSTGFEVAEGGVHPVPIDPSGGPLLELLVETPAPLERIRMGGVVGDVILGLGALALCFGLLRLLSLSMGAARVARTQRNPRPGTKDPLARLLAVPALQPGEEREAFEARLEERLLAEASRLQSGLWFIRAVQVAAPLLGLLGTVTGMIETFQAITTFGAGDARMMAGGISAALVTTMLGLGVAIPLVLLSSALNGFARKIASTLESAAAGRAANGADV